MKKTNLFPISAFALVAVTLVGCNYFSGDDEISSTYGTEKVENEQFIVSFSEGGELVSVKAVTVESEMDGSSTIVNIVEEGTDVEGPTKYSYCHAIVGFVHRQTPPIFDRSAPLIPQGREYEFYQWKFRFQLPDHIRSRQQTVLRH